MSNNFISLLNNYSDLLSFTDSLFWVMDNTANNAIERNINLVINNLKDINSNGNVSDIDIPYNKINNSFYFDRIDNSITDEGNNYLDIYETNINEKKIAFKFKDIYKDNDLIFNIKKDSNFNFAIKEIISNNGEFRLLDIYDNILYRERELTKYLSNNSVNEFMIDNGDKYLVNNIPLLVSDKDIYTTKSYLINDFILKIPISYRNNILSNLITEKTDKLNSEKFKSYNIFIKIYFNINNTDMLPLDFLHNFNRVSNYSSKMINNNSIFNLIVNNVPSNIDLISMITNGKFDNIYLKFK